MKSAIPNWLLSLSAVALLLANWQVRRARTPPTDSAPAPEAHATASGAAPTLDRTPAAEPDAKPGPKPAFDWANLETTDYKQYVSHLKRVGFPDDLVRSILIADINKLYEPRELALKPKPVPFDASFAERQPNKVTDEDWDRAKRLWQLRIEKQVALQNILGSYVPREILRTPRSLNYESYEYAIGQLPVDKRNAVQLAQENYVLAEGMQVTSMTDREAELENYKRLRAERDAALRAILTPEEFDRFNMNTTPAGTELARRTIGMEPSDEEFAGMFEIVYKNWLDTGGVYGRWRAVPVPRDQIAASDQERDASLKNFLGEARYVEYRMTGSESGQKLRNFAARFELPPDLVTQAFELQSERDALAKARQAAIVKLMPDGTVIRTPTPTTQPSDAESRLRELLGPELWLAWEAGRQLKVNLDP